jgi:hypothetical protein
MLSPNGGGVVLNEYHFGGFYGSDGSSGLSNGTNSDGASAFVTTAVQHKCPVLIQRYHQLLGFGRVHQPGECCTSGPSRTWTAWRLCSAAAL